MIYGAEESLFLMEDKVYSFGLINFVRRLNVHTEQTTDRFSWFWLLLNCLLKKFLWALINFNLKPSLPSKISFYAF